MPEKMCPDCNVPLLRAKGLSWVCAKCGNTYVPPRIFVKEIPLGGSRCNRGVSDITRKQLERIVEAEQCQVILLFDDDAAVVFRDGIVETMIPSVREQGPEHVPQNARNVLLTLTLFQNPDLLKTAEKILAQRILDTGEEDANRPCKD